MENKRNLQQAVFRFAGLLKGKGARVSIVYLPAGTGKGLDDYLLTHTIDDFKRLPMKEMKTQIVDCLESWNSIRNMEINVEWIVDRLFPRNAIILLFGKGGIGKTWLILDIARSIGLGNPWLQLQTIQTQVIFIDFENPLAVLNIRTQKLGQADNVFFWRSNNQELKAPRLDSKDWEMYKQLPIGSVLIFDTLRASQGGDENASDAMARVMNRLKELRDMGFTVILLHHTAKNSDKVAKGSTAIVDLADHILGLTQVRKKKDGVDVVIDDEDSEEDAVYKFGVREKTRFEPYHIYLTLNPDHGFELAPDPQEETLKAMYTILQDQGDMKKTPFLKECNDRMSVSEKKLRKLFDIGHGRYWQTENLKTDNVIIVRAIRFGGLADIYRGGKPKNQNPVPQSERKTDEEITNENIDNKGFCGLANGVLKTEKPISTINSEFPDFLPQRSDVNNLREVTL